MAIDTIWDWYKTLYITSEEVIKTAINFYKELYAHKPSDKLAFRQILRCVNKRINYRLKESMTQIISEREIIVSIKWATLRKLSNSDNLFLKFYKAL